MIICKYGITLRLLTQSDLELVRQKRNSEYVQQFMEYREHITPEMQEKWFEGINTHENYYFVIEYQNKKIGLINSKNRNAEKQGSEAGLFLWDEEYTNTFVPILISLLLFECEFYVVEGKKCCCHVLKSNKHAISYVKQLGYERCENQENIENQRYEITKERFIAKAQKLRRAVNSLFSEEEKTGYLLIEPSDVDFGITQYFESFVDSPKSLFRMEHTPQGKKYFIDPKKRGNVDSESLLF